MGLWSQMNVIRLTHTPTKKQCLYHSEVALRPFSVSHRTCSASSPLSHYPHSLHHWLDLPFLESDINDITVCVLLHPASFTQHILLERLVHVVACISVSFFLLLSRAALCEVECCNTLIRSPVDGHLDVSSFRLWGVILLWDSGQVLLCQYSFNLLLSLWLRFWGLFKWVRAIRISFSINFLFKSWPIFQ